jgi:thiol-disulfide isomerase/thioredoxin
MKFTSLGTTILLLLLNAGGARSDGGREVQGRVLDEQGRPVAGADVSWWWRANGPPSLKDAKGKSLLDTPEGQKAFWGNVGKMEPWHAPATTDAEGRFSFSFADGPRVHHLMAMNASRTRGALVLLPKGNAQGPLEIHLAPLTRVKGSIEGPAKGARPEWTFVYTLVPEDAERPLDTNRLAGCGSNEARFEMALPPGRYSLNAYTYTFKGDEKADVVPDREVEVTGKVPVIDLGVLHLSSFKPTITALKERAKAAGTWSDYTRHYGEKPPAWHVVDARGVKKDVQIADFKGKWLLVDFWGLSCSSCLRHSLPELMKFYEAHQSERDRFEILAICIDIDGEIKSIAELDKQLQPIIKYVWGQPLPFPILLDPTFKTWERYGLPGLGTTVLIDPDGKLVKGDEKTLAEKLRAR